MSRIIKCAYSKTFPISQYFEKIYLEAEINESDDVRKELYNLKKLVNDFFYENNAAAEKQMGTWTTESKMQPIVDLMENHTISDQIETVTDLKVLETYRLLVRNNPDAEKTYLKKLKELQP